MDRTKTILVTSFFIVITLFVIWPRIEGVLFEKTPIPLEKPLSYTLPVLQTGSVYEIMNTVSSSFPFKGKLYKDLGFFVEEIEGIQNSNGFYWTLYVNGVYSKQGVSLQKVQPGDTIEWRYEKL